MKKIATLTLLLISFINYSQKGSNYTFGEITKEEIDMKVYDKDSTANALVLNEYGNSIFKFESGLIVIQTTFYKKLKIFNSEGFKHSIFELGLYKSGKKKEKVIKLKGITHNKLNKTFLKKSNIYKNEINENWDEVSFTMPNVNEGSIIEVEYIIESPFKYNLTGWKFQEEIPKIKSIYTATIPGNYIYNRNLKGYLNLTTNSSDIKKRCFIAPNNYGHSDCEVITYGLENIPAFEKEDYMTDSDNFISKIDFELSEFKWFDGSSQKYTKTWEAVDQEFKTNENFGKQLKKTNLLNNLIPEEINKIESDIEKAKAIYSFIQNYFNWNKKNQIFKEVNIKNAIKNKVGNIAEINISLINALKSAGLNSELVLLSTRDNGLPTRKHPVISDFNYVIALLNINNKIYLLDASEKFNPFGILPFRCLNGYARVMDYKNGSYWIDIVPIKNSKTVLTTSLSLNSNEEIVGKIRKAYIGYDAINKRAKIQNKSNDDLISEFENEFNNLEVLNYTIENKDDIDKPLVEIIEILITDFDNTSTIYFNPFFDEKFSKNPFMQKNRLYPVDFGYQRKFVLNLLLNIPDTYKIASYPKSVSYILKENGGKFTLKTNNQESGITLNSLIEINKPIFYNFEYQTLKEIFNHIIISQKTPIKIKKVN